ncbi:MAG: hypothetical protein HUU22_00680 [Phycisphaerae bacterium]|nr:hypothetical protein [Phycisphaerae bacterium]NUQ44529.1 hypothetical protein [Phycisphaerae bacterium]
MNRAACSLPLAWLLAIAAGCAPYSTYRVEVNLPWPDEPASRRASYERRLRLTQPILHWHARIRPEDLADEIRRAAAAEGDIYVFVRDGLARRDTGDGPGTLRYVEAHVGPRLIPSAVFTPPTNDPDLPPLIRLADRAGIRLQAFGSIAQSGSPDVPSADAPLPRFMRAVVAQGYMLSCARHRPFTIRSFEYESRDDFVRVVEDTIEAISEDVVETPIRLVALDEWLAQNAASHFEIMQTLKREYRPRQVGRDKWTQSPAPPTPNYLPSDLADARRQLLLAMPVLLGESDR